MINLFLKFILIILLFSLENLLANDIYKVGFAQDTLVNDWRVAQVDEVKKEIKKYPYLKLTVKDAKTSVANQIADIEYFIENSYDFIITSPINAQITSKVLKKAIDANIKVILISRGITTQDYTTFIAPDNKKIGQEIAMYMVKKLKGKVTILMLEGIDGATSTKCRTDGFEDIIKRYPNITIVKRRANYLRSDAIDVMEDIYEKNIKFDAIFSHSDSMLSGARYVMKKYNKDLSILMVGIDYIKEAQEAILNNEQTASFTYPTSAKQGVQAIVNLINNGKIIKHQIIESTMITKENVKIVTPIF